MLIHQESSSSIIWNWLHLILSFFVTIEVFCFQDYYFVFVAEKKIHSCDHLQNS